MILEAKRHGKFWVLVSGNGQFVGKYPTKKIMERRRASIIEKRKRDGWPEWKKEKA